MYLTHALFETIWNCTKHMKTWKQGRLRVQCDTLWYDILTCRENFESNEAKWCILTLLCSSTYSATFSHFLEEVYARAYWAYRSYAGDSL